MTEEKKKDEVINDLETRVKAFNEELIPLLAKYKLGLGGQPLLTVDGRIVAKPFIFDDSKPVSSDEKPKADEKPANAPVSA